MIPMFVWGCVILLLVIGWFCSSISGQSLLKRVSRVPGDPEEEPEPVELSEDARRTWRIVREQESHHAKQLRPLLSQLLAAGGLVTLASGHLIFLFGALVHISMGISLPASLIQFCLLGAVLPLWWWLLRPEKIESDYENITIISWMDHYWRFSPQGWGIVFTGIGEKVVVTKHPRSVGVTIKNVDVKTKDNVSLTIDKVTLKVKPINGKDLLKAHFRLQTVQSKVEQYLSRKVRDVFANYTVEQIASLLESVIKREIVAQMDMELIVYIHVTRDLVIGNVIEPSEVSNAQTRVFIAAQDQKVGEFEAKTDAAKVSEPLRQLLNVLREFTPGLDPNVALASALGILRVHTLPKLASGNASLFFVDGDSVGGGQADLSVLQGLSGTALTTELRRLVRQHQSSTTLPPSTTDDA